METVYYNTFVARTEIAERLQNYRRERMTLDRIRPFASIVNWATQTYAAVTQFVENARVELQNWSDSQRACLPDSPVLADC